jgi:sulfoxide reductase heme-binding subunit YedZ
VNGPSFVLASTTLIIAAAAATIAASGYNEESVRIVVRLTARTSLALFLAAFLASAFRRRWKNQATIWIRRNRRALGLAFAGSHLIHLAAIAALTRFHSDFDATTLIVGGIGYVFIVLLAVTSNDRAVKALGANWRRLHTVGIYYLWFVFTATYGPAFLHDPAATIAIPALLSGLGFRLSALKGRSY